MNYDLIKPYIEKGLVSEQNHPDCPSLKIFNYTQRCQFERIWDDVTMQCRGLILDTEKDVVIARPFPKFFNYGEYIEKCWPIPSEIPIITEKLDGSLGILYWINDKPWVATRGSFTSEQAVWATKWFRENIDYDAIPESNGVETFLFEILYPENRIVVNYDYSGLVLITVRDTLTGVDLPHEEVKSKITDMGVKSMIAKVIPATSLYELSKLDEPNGEGFVAYYPKADKRIKLKFPEYVRLHKLVTGVSEIAIWEHLSEGNPLDDLLEKVPDEFFKWVEGVQNRLRAEWAKLWGEAQMAVQMCQYMETRKDQAVWIMNNAKKVSSVVFLLLDKKDKKASAAVWKMVRPHGRTGFKHDIDL